MTIRQNASRRALLVGVSGSMLTSACTSFFSATPDTGDNALKRETRAAMKRAARFMRERVAYRGGYVWSYAADFSSLRALVILRKGKDAEAFDAAKMFTEAEADVIRKAEEKAAKMAAAAEAVKKEFKNKPASGLMYNVIQEGTGKMPSSPASSVTVHYAGMFLDGK